MKRCNLSLPLAHFCRLSVFLALSETLLPTNSNADVYISNIDKSIYSSFFSNDEMRAGVSFTTDNDSYFLNSITIKIAFAQFLPANILNGVLYAAGSNGVPLSDTVLQTFTNPSAEPQETWDPIDLAFTPVGTYALSPNSTYMFALSIIDPQIFIDWCISPVSEGSTTNVPGSAWSIYEGAFHFSYDYPEGGWYNVFEGADGWAMVSIDAAPVPEPSTYLLLGAATLLGLAAKRHL